jgi:hypothetical protein
MTSRQDQHAPSKTARVTQQGTSKPAQLPVTRPRHAVDDPRLIDSRDIRHPVPVRVGDLIIPSRSAVNRQ